MDAMQAQGYLSALWAVGLGTLEASEQSVERALAEARIVSTWRRELNPGRVELSYNAFDELDPAAWQELGELGER